MDKLFSFGGYGKKICKKSLFFSLLPGKSIVGDISHF